MQRRWQTRMSLDLLGRSFTPLIKPRIYPCFMWARICLQSKCICLPLQTRIQAFTSNLMRTLLAVPLCFPRRWPLPNLLLAWLRYGTNFTLTAEAIDPDNQVSSVSYYIDGQFVGFR